jgi:hypothetical protein
MGHDIHFLERVTARANPEHQAIAMALYRDPQLIQHIAKYFMPLMLGEVDRVALALDDGGKGPHVIVTKQGKFVTCLGEGMEVQRDTPVISRALLEECEAWRRRPVEGDERAHEMLLQMSRAMDRRGPSRAEVEIVEAMGGLYARDFLDWLAPEDEELLPKLEKTLQRRSARRHRLGKAHEETLLLLKQGWMSQQRRATYGGVMFALCIPQATPLQRADLAEALSLLMLTGPAQYCTPMSILWSAWCKARYDKPAELIARHTRQFQSSEEDYAYQEGGRRTIPLALYMWGLLHPDKREGLLEVLRGYVGSLREVTSEPDVVAGLERTIVALEEGLDAQPLAMRLKRLAELPGVQHTSWHKQFREVEGADEQALLWDLLEHDGALIDAICEDWLLWAYAPMMVNRPVRELFPESPRVWTRQEIAAKADTLLRQRIARRQRAMLQEVQASKPAQGRNEPCACGSGKKYKRCCGQDTDA